MTAMLADYFLQKQPGSTILYNAICGRIVPQVIEARGGYGERTRVGHSFIKADMREQDAIFAGEHSGHYYFKDNYFADSGLIAAMIAIQVVADSGKKLSEIAAQYTKGFTAIPETNFTVTDKEAILDRLSVALSDGEQDWLDGLTVTYEDGWVNVRPSNTEPLLRLNAEAHSQQRLTEIVSRVTGLIEGE
jgi:phosphomannomutase